MPKQLRRTTRRHCLFSADKTNSTILKASQTGEDGSSFLPSLHDPSPYMSLSKEWETKVKFSHKEVKDEHHSSDYFKKRNGALFREKENHQINNFPTQIKKRSSRSEAKIERLYNSLEQDSYSACAWGHFVGYSYFSDDQDQDFSDQRRDLLFQKEDHLNNGNDYGEQIFYPLFSSYLEPTIQKTKILKCQYRTKQHEGEKKQITLRLSSEPENSELQSRSILNVVNKKSDFITCDNIESELSYLKNHLSEMYVF
mmetsp:Transcript_56915/g.66526  ORF Transcript_56915/g.66526 Transcript_56915/m.66526 type:complete len:255 (+) Transcript_56915:117-881(+)